jgi:hypothetical protein
VWPNAVVERYEFGHTVIKLKKTNGVTFDVDEDTQFKVKRDPEFSRYILNTLVSTKNLIWNLGDIEGKDVDVDYRYLSEIAPANVPTSPETGSFFGEGVYECTHYRPCLYCPADQPRPNTCGNV